MVLLTALFSFLLLIALPLGEIVRIDFGNGVAFTLLDIVVACISIITVVYVVKQKKLSILLFKPFLFFIAICILSLFINSFHLTIFQLFVAFLYLARWVMYFFIFFALRLLSKKSQQKITIFMIFAGLLILAGGYIQYFFYPALRNLYYLGWDQHLYRMFSSFFDPNFLGAFLVLYLLFIIGLLFRNIHNKKRTVLFSVISITTLIAIYLTYSRSAYIMLVTGITIMLYLSKISKIIKMIIIGGFVIIFLLSFLFYRPSEGTNLFRSVSTLGRIGSADNALIIFSKNPILGVGFNAYRYSQYQQGFVKGQAWQTGHGGAGSDNSWLFVLATTGIFGFIAYCYFWVILLKTAWDKKKKNIYALIFFVSAMSLFIDSLFINSLFYPSLMTWMWMIYALTQDYS